MKKTHSLKIFIFPATLLSITALSSLIASSTHTYADISDSVDDNITITVDSSCLIGQSIVSDHTTQLNPGEMNSTIGESRIRGYCNDTNGYAIYAIGYTNGELGNTNLLSTDGNIIATGTSGANSYWNMKLTPASSGSYTPNVVSPFTNNTTIPTEYTKVAYFDSFAPGPTSGQNAISDSYIATTYETHLSTTQPSGVYYGQVQYVLVHPSSAPAPIFMQDTDVIKARLTNVGDTMQVTDKRDGKRYWISKRADNNIWMTQNLDFNINANRTYTSADTDITTNWTPLRSTIATDKLSAQWENSSTTPYSYDPGDIYYYHTADAANRYTSLASCKQDHPDCSSKNHIGNYYNWSAAVASNNTTSLSTPYDNAPDSICPAGWRLPTGTDAQGTSSSKEFNELFVDEGVIESTNEVFTPDGYEKLLNTPLWFTMSGYVDSGSTSRVGSSGYYWSSTISDALYVYYSNFRRGNIFPSNTNTKYYGFSMRCLIK